jgi:diguanylate cyclase (GGDEF)-like protein
LEEVLARVVDDDRPEAHRLIDDVAAGRDFEATIRARALDGRLVWLRTRARSHGTGATRRAVGTSHDVTEQKQAEVELAAKALVDPLTDLPNRAMLDRWLRHLLFARDGAVTLLFVDLDRFKLVNDALGHAGGDDVLRELARRLVGVTQPHHVARIGGDEFVVLAERLTVEQQRDLVERVLAALSEPVRALDHRVQLSASVGVANAERGVTPELLLRHADLAMYRAKQRGRARAAWFDATMQAGADRRAIVLAALRDAVREGAITAALQPIVDLRSGALAGFEALARWHHPELGDIGPDEFIPLAEDAGLVAAIGDQILRQGVRALDRWRRAGLVAKDTFVAVNVSAGQFADPELVDRVSAALHELGLPGHVLHVEITETTLMGDAEEATHALERLRRLGAKVCIDDFGTGYCSLAYLKQLSVDALKIDRSFLDSLSDEPTDTTIVRAIIGLAHALGLHTVAEGVETHRQRTIVRDLGCDLGQGYLWSRPQTIDDTAAWLSARRR